MIKNYFKIAWRNLLKHKVYSTINIVGLATGMAVALLIGFWIWDELSFNTYHKNYQTLGQVYVEQTFNGITGADKSTALPSGKAMRENYPEFKYVVMTSSGDNHILAVGDTKISKAGMWVQPEFPVMFSLKMISGEATALKDPASILLSQSVAQSLFGNTDPVNKLVKVDNRIDLKVAGVFEDLPYNTTLRDTKILMSWDKMLSTYTWLKGTETDWDNHWHQIFVQLNEHTDFEKAGNRIRDLVKPHAKNYEYTKETLLLHPMRKWRLYDNLEVYGQQSGRIRFVWLFGIIGVFVLLLACINFMNLSTARSEKRAKEVGIRKAVGSLRGQLIWQFFSESLLVAFLAFVLALLMVQLALPSFNLLADKQVVIPVEQPLFWLLLVGFTLFTGLISGSYPAFYLSGFEPLKVLKGTFRVGRFAALPRKVLVVVQFTVSIILIIGTLIVYKQIQYAQSRPVGYTREGLITVEMNTPDLAGHYNKIRDALLETGMVADMGESNSAPTKIYSSNTGFEWKGKAAGADPLFGTIAVTHDFGKTIGWTILAGRDFSRDFATDSGALILNESAVKITGIKDPVGKTMRWQGRERFIVGVVKDMVMVSPYEPAFPTIFHMEYGWVNLITIRIKPTVAAATALAAIGGVFKRYNPGSPFEYKFTDEVYAQKFEDEKRIGNLSTCFTVFAIFISCLGLFGLASFVAEQRTKEIGVRKVLGASVFNLWQMQSKEFILLVGIACLIAVPIAWYVLHEWLQQYQYRAAISWWIFVLAGISALGITLITISYQAVKAALMNPVKSLRTE